jgi:hypothetical protein
MCSDPKSHPLLVTSFRLRFDARRPNGRRIFGTGRRIPRRSAVPVPHADRGPRARGPSPLPRPAGSGLDECRRCRECREMATECPNRTRLVISIRGTVPSGGATQVGVVDTPRLATGWPCPGQVGTNFDTASVSVPAIWDVSDSRRVDETGTANLPTAARSQRGTDAEEARLMNR